MIYFRYIFFTLFLYSFSAIANEIQIIELHKNKSLDQLVLETENSLVDNNLDESNTKKNDSNVITVNDDANVVAINDDDELKNTDKEILSVKKELLFDLEINLISRHLETIKNIKSKTLHREFINILSNIDLGDDNTYNNKVYFVIKKLYEIGEIEKAYKLVEKINLENSVINNQNLEYFYLIKLNYLYSSFQLSEVCDLRLFLLEKSINLPNNLLQKTDIFCLTLENNFAEANLLNSLLLESEIQKDENFQTLFNFMLLNEQSESFVSLGSIKSKDLIFLYSAMLRINELPLDKDFIEVDSLNLSIPVILSESTSMDIRIKAAHKAYYDDLLSINSLSALYQSVDFTSNQFINPANTIANLNNEELIMAYYYQLTNIQIFPDERLDVILKYWDFAKKSGLEKIAYAITEKIIETFTPGAENSEDGIHIAFAQISNKNYEDALTWLKLYEISNSTDKKIDQANFLIDLNQNDNFNTIINYISDNSSSFDGINNQSTQESFQVLMDFLKIENISMQNLQYANILDDRLMPSYFLINDIKNHINEKNDLSVFTLTLISMHNKKWIELHPEHFHLILEAFNFYDNGSLKKQIVIEILNEFNIF